MKYELPADFVLAFKDADVRGVFPNEINAGLAYFIARSFVDEFGYKKLVVGCDMRVSSPELKEAFIAGAREAGANVVDVGLVATPQLYFASGSLNLPGVMITASHSPKDYNGLKLVHAQAVPLTKRNGLSQILKRIKSNTTLTTGKKGSLTQKNIDQAYIKYVLRGIKSKHYAGLRIATDIGNGMAHDIVPLLEQHLPIKFDKIFNRLDGRFPNRDSDPNLHENQVALDQKLDHGHYDFGISFDGDADRIAFLDEQGNYVNSAVIGAIIAKQILRQSPKAAFATTNFNGRIYEETIKNNKGKVVMAKTGHTFVKEKMRQHEAVFGCEYSGHFFFKNFFYTDSVVLTLRAILDAYLEAKAQGLTFGQMVKPFEKYWQTEDVVIHVKDRDLVMSKVQAYLLSLKPKTIKKFDGYYVDFGDVWGAVKPSVTEYAVKMMFESASKKSAQNMQKQIQKFVKSVAKETK